MTINESPVNIEYSFEEHEILNDILNHALDSVDLGLYGEIYNLPEDSPIVIRYKKLQAMRDHSFELWSNRFGVNS